MKILIAVLLAAFSTNVMAEWTMVSGDDYQTAYADLSTIRKSGNRVKMWTLLDYKVVHTSKTNGARYLSAVAQMEYDCKEETARLSALIWYSKSMSQGEVVYSSGAMPEDFNPMPPGSVGEILFKIACGK